MSGATIGWGLVSTGRICQDFAAALAARGGTLAAVCSRTAAAARAFGEPRNVPPARCFGSLAELLACDAVDVVYVGTPHAAHYAAVRAALAARKPVLCEKAFTVAGPQARALVAAARAQRVLLAEGMWTRHFPAWRALRALLHEERAIGDVVAVHGVFGFEDDGSAHRLTAMDCAGGALLDIGVYLLWAASLALQFHTDAGRVVDVRATARKGATGCDTRTSMALTLADGRRADLVCSIAAALPNQFTFVGETGYITVEAPFHCTEALLVSRGGGPAETLRFPIDGAQADDAERFNFVNSRGFIYEIGAVEAALAASQTELPDAPLDETLAIMDLMDKVRDQIDLNYGDDLESV